MEKQKSTTNNMLMPMKSCEREKKVFVFFIMRVVDCQSLYYGRKGSRQWGIKSIQQALTCFLSSVPSKIFVGDFFCVLTTFWGFLQKNYPFTFYIKVIFEFSPQSHHHDAKKLSSKPIKPNKFFKKPISVNYFLTNPIFISLPTIIFPPSSLLSSSSPSLSFSFFGIWIIVVWMFTEQ